MVSAPSSPPRSPRGDEIIGKLRKPPPLKRRPAGTSRFASSNLDEADLEILADLGSRLELAFASVEEDRSLNPPPSG